MEISQVSIIIPAFNEDKAIGAVIQSLKEKFTQADIIVVNDGSTDDTREIAYKSGARVLDHDYQRGYGASLRTGIFASDREYVLFCDGDGQHNSEDVETLITAADGYDLVVGVRGPDSYEPSIRRPGKFVLRLFTNFLAGTKIPDLTSGLRIFKRETIVRYLHLMPSGFSFSATSTFAMIKGGRRF